MSLRDKIVSCVLALALLLSAVTLPIHATVVDSEYRVTDASAVETDLNYLYVDGEKYSAGNYPRNTADAYLYIMQFLEVGYNGLRFDSDAGLYVYLYNPSAKTYLWTDARNQIQLKIGAGAWQKFDLLYCDINEEKTIVKYKVDISVSDLNVALSGIANRTYEVSDIELYYGIGLNATSYTVGGSFTYSRSGKELYCKTDVFHTIELDLNATYYRPSTISSEGLNTRNEVDSVYFAIPNSILEKYNSQLYSIQGEYYENRIYSIITENEEYSMWMQQYVGGAIKDLPGYEDNQLASKSLPAIYDTIVRLTDYSFAIGTGINVVARPNFLVYNNVLERLPVIPYIFHKEEIKNYECAVTFEELQERIRLNGLITTTGTPNTLKTQYDIKMTDGYTLKPYAATHGAFAAWCVELGTWFKQDAFDETVIDQAIAPVMSDIILMTDSKASNEYFVAEADVPKIKQAYMTAAAQDKTVYILRFAQTVAKTYEVSIDPQDSGIPVDNKNEKTFLYEQSYFKDFDIVSLTFKDSYGSFVVLPVSSDPVDVGGDMFLTDDDPFGKDFKKGLKDIAKIFALILGLIALIVILLVFNEYILPPLRKSFTSLTRNVKQTGKKIKNKFTRKKRKRK